MENINTRLQRPILLTENYHTIAKQYGYTKTFGNGFLGLNGNFYIGLTQSALVWDGSSTNSMQGEKTAVLEHVIDWNRGK